MSDFQSFRHIRPISAQQFSLLDFVQLASISNLLPLVWISTLEPPQATIDATMLSLEFYTGFLILSIAISSCFLAVVDRAIICSLKIKFLLDRSAVFDTRFHIL